MEDYESSEKEYICWERELFTFCQPVASILLYDLFSLKLYFKKIMRILISVPWNKLKIINLLFLNEFFHGKKNTFELESRFTVLTKFNNILNDHCVVLGHPVYTRNAIKQSNV